MPNYQYECSNPKCRKVDIIKQSIHDSALITCLYCKKDTWRRILFPSMLCFKGDGFYCTEGKTGKKIKWTD